MLAKEGIEVVLKNEHTSTGMHPQFMYLEVWAKNDGDHLRALDLISKFESKGQTVDWQCPDCNEMNDASFEICWN